MELQHRFDLPVGIDEAWSLLTDVAEVAPCFPGARLDSVDGSTFSGSLRFKAGPVRLTYRGTGRLTERDDAGHTATWEATGGEGSAHSAGQASVLVTARLTAGAPNLTRVDLVTTLALTGRPARFGRPLMVEVGNRHISEFADAMSRKLVGRGAGGARLIDVENPDAVAAERTQADRASGATGRTPGGRTFAGDRPGKASRALTTVAPVVLLVVCGWLLRRLFRSPDQPAANTPDSG